MTMALPCRWRRRRPASTPSPSKSRERKPDVGWKAKMEILGKNPMKTFAQILIPLLFVSIVSAQQGPWQRISDPTAAQLAAKFASPPSEYNSQFDWGFSDKLTREAIAAILDHAKSLGVMGAFVEPKVGNSPYLSAGYFQAVKILVEEARKRDMHLWFDDDGGYPSGFAGGKFTNERPDLRMERSEERRVGKECRSRWSPYH